MSINIGKKLIEHSTHTTKRRIEPTLISNHNQQANVNGVNGLNTNTPVNFPMSFQITPEMFCLPENKSKKPKEYILETKLMCHKLEQFEENIYLLWENKNYDNVCNISLQIDNGILYSNRFDSRQIRYFTCNNFLYAFYDTKNQINIFTLFNTVVSTI
jgi:hypothetical protein